MNFDTIIDRKNTHSAKWDMMQPLFNVSADDGIAMWVADMDFPPPEAVSKAIKTMLNNQVMGYYGADKSYKDAIIGWMARRHNWTVDPSWIFTTHGLVNATALCIQAFSNKGDGVILFTPVYHQFEAMIVANERQLVGSDLVNIDGRYTFDLEALEAKLTGNESILIMCSPHNPCGTVWTKDELHNVAKFCAQHKIVMICDEIHHDLVFSGAKHTVMPLAAPEYMHNIVMLTAATKSFNIAGCLTGNVIVQDEKLRKIYEATAKAGAIHGHAFGQNMCEAAYNEGDEWLDACLAYIENNCKIFDEAIHKIPGVKSIQLESTYLAWVDFSGTGMSDAEITKRIQEKAKIACSPGWQFGDAGKLFMRFNLACSKHMVIEAAARLTKAFDDLQ